MLVTTTYLEMTDPAELRPAGGANPEFRIEHARIPSPDLGRFLYTAVGWRWYWIDRLGWSYQEWLAYLGRPEIETWVGSLQGTPAGFYEQAAQPDGSVEIVSFGLMPRFVGQRLGGQLLTHAVERAWQRGANRVWLHTCTLDSPIALNNYQARGFRIFKVEERETALTPASGSPTPPAPWPGAGPID